MVAGDSAGAESRRQLALADAHAKAAAEARAAAGRFGIAETTERQTARTLAPLSALGYFLLPDRRWPGTRRAQVDLVVVGPGGVFIVDTKAWKEVGIDNGRVLRGDDDVTDELLMLNDLVDVTQADLAEVGLAPGEVRSLVVMAGRAGLDATVSGIRIVGERDALSAIARHGNRLTPTQVDTVMGRALSFFPQASAPAPVTVTIPAPVVPAAPSPVTPPPPHLAQQDALLTPEEVNDALLEGILAQPIEEWMSFLHPQQAKLVRRSFPGPSRIRGPAGTGKTVVGLHRAAHLARNRPGRILVTTYVRTLPDVLHELLRRLAPEVVDRVEFVGAHAFARRILRERGVPHRIEPAQSREAFDAAWHRVGAPSVLGSSQDRRYWEDEIEHVLKGRGITRFEDYADLARTGRRRTLQLSGREAVWRLHEAYDAELRSRGIIDYADLILLAEAELRREPMTGAYSAVIVDEAQDLSCAMIRMLHLLVGDEPDGFTLIGDGQQSIYPGGYTLGEAGISVAGRGVVLDINYRNTAQIVNFAQRLVAGDEYADIEGVLARGDVPASVPRKGADPVIAHCGSRRELNDALIARVRSVTTDIGTGIGDVAVLCISRWAARDAARALEQAGFPVVDLEKYNGVPVDAVKVGTIKRAKGLEFKQVLIPDIRNEHTITEPPADDTARERWDLTRRELYVAMTRARDGLWVGISN
ncbi:UvrD-helicase domain-containing protein [Tessaracoccus sp. MC1627]|uniref:nuclease-related domain-containing DEAD/DEAH box helicase n=1 Tax=Tessaracoccus sp. MC1627 TaxID=2760312 RepID=UPI001603053F|nr:UvrD-helicase domain-containing protein [Tessaracoccus sp. MC1627]MBB1512593.1 UvrD-helicase domain-containing protein [Tessaracoccus sp. MC1627]